VKLSSAMRYVQIVWNGYIRDIHQKREKSRKWVRLNTAGPLAAEMEGLG
jgi:hypothetical protein